MIYFNKKSPIKEIATKSPRHKVTPKILVSFGALAIWWQKNNFNTESTLN